MQSNARIVPISPVSVQPASAAQSGDFRDSPASREAELAARYRLVIEEGPSPGAFIYKTMDRVTGEVVRQLPREQVVDLMRDGTYNAGSVIDTTA